MARSLAFWVLICGLAGTMVGAQSGEEDQFFELPGDYAASHILIAYKNAERADPKVTRSKKEALAKAESLLERLAADPGQFEALAQAESDGPTAVYGGNLVSFRKGEMAPSFEAALKKLEPGQITDKPVKTPFGYHLIRRNAMRAKYYSARQILIAYQGATTIAAVEAAAYTRTKAEAEKLIREIAGSATPQNFSEIATTQSDLPRKDGFVGVFKSGDSPLTQQMIDALKGLRYGEISEVVELSVGFALLQRIKVAQRAASRIWISYQTAKNAPESLTRSREEAEQLAMDLAAQLKEDPARFEELAKTHSDGPFAVRGGVMPLWFVGYQEPAFEQAVEGLAVEGITQTPVVTETGFYLIKRLANP